MNKIACCLSGLPSQKIVQYIKVLEPYTKFCDFFIFFWNFVDDSTKHEIIDTLKPKAVIFSNQMNFGFDAKYKEPDKRDNKHNQIAMFYGISEVQKMRRNYEEIRKCRYDIVFRLRYDLYFIDGFEYVIDRIKSCMNDKSIVMPWTRHHIGVCDQFWAGMSNVMDHFIDLFSWIQKHINELYFVTENVLYQFIISKKINFVCTDIRYALMRDYMQIGFSEMHRIYGRQMAEPWSKPCEETRAQYYDTYFDMKNNSANTIYFLTKQVYCPINVIIQNRSSGKFLYYDESQSKNTLITGSQKSTVFMVHILNSFLVTITASRYVENKLLIKKMVVVDWKLSCMENVMGSERKSHFFIIKKGDDDLISVNVLNTNKNGTYGNYLYMNNDDTIYADGDDIMPTSRWNIIVV